MRTPKATPTFKENTEEGESADRKEIGEKMGIEARIWSAEGQQSKIFPNGGKVHCVDLNMLTM